MYLNVEIEYPAPPDPAAFRDWAARHPDRRVELIDHLETGGFVVCLRLKQTTVHAAVNVALNVSNGWLADAPGCGMLEPTALHVAEQDRTDRLVGLMGIQEIALMFDVTRQRASQIVKTRSFPKPVAPLAMGPVFTRRSVLRHAKETGRRILVSPSLDTDRPG